MPGFLYLVVVLDAWNRRHCPLVHANHLRTELVLEALQMAIGERRPAGELIHHSDQVSQYNSLTFGNCCREAGVRPSVDEAGQSCVGAADGYQRRVCGRCL